MSKKTPDAAPLASYERKLTFSSPEAYRILKAKNDIVLRGRAISARVEKDQQELEKLGMKIQKLQDQMIAYSDKHWRGLLKPTEDTRQVAIENGKVTLYIYDKVQHFEHALLKQREDAAKKAADEKAAAPKEAAKKAKKA